MDRALSEELAAMRKALRASTRGIDRAKKALDMLSSPGALERLEQQGAHIKALRDADLSPWGLDEARKALAGELSALHESQRARARASLLRELSERARAQGDELIPLGDTPLTVQLGPLSVEIDIAKGEARVSYARALVDTCPASAPEILKTCEAARAKITEDALPSPEFFELLRKAYRIALIARGARPGERVDLVDLLHPLALLRVEVDRWRKTPLGKIPPHPRYLLSYQLHRLRRDGALVQGGQRVELGVATGGSARDKRGVVFIPSSPTEGQYHLSIRFSAAD